MAVIWFFSERFVVDSRLEARTLRTRSTLPVSRPPLPEDLISVVPGLVMTSKSCYRFLRDEVPSLRVLLSKPLHGSCCLSQWSDVQTLALPAEDVDRH
jgi:hypothetical protein